VAKQCRTLIPFSERSIQSHVSGLDGKALHVLVVGNVLLDGILDDLGGLLAVLGLPLLVVLLVCLLWLSLQELSVSFNSGSSSLGR